MSDAATLQINTTGYGQPAFAETDNFPYSDLAYYPGYAFATGFQTITAPTGAVGVKITNLDGTLTIKGDTTDVGIAITEAENADFPFMLPLTTNWTVTASAGATADLIYLIG